MTIQESDLIKEVMETERVWVEAHRQVDVAAIERLMADDYVRIEPDGHVSSKAEVLASYTPETRHWDYAEGNDYRVRIYGNTAVVIGRWRARGVNNDVPFDYAARFMSVYVRQGGRWQMVAEQSTPEAHELAQ